MTLTARPRFLIRFAVLAALALCGIVLALSSTGTPPVGAQDGSLPAKPTGVVATATHDSVALAWDNPDDASITHYQIFRRDRGVHDTGEFVTIEDDTGSAAASYTDDTVEPETRYVYRVKAVNQHGASTWSDFVRADTPAAPDPADLAPSGLEVSLVENRVTLTWDAPASDAASVTGYEILRRRPNDGEAALTTLVADTGNAETGYTDDSANEPGVRYTYRVRALRDGEQSKVSNYARIDLPDDYAQDTPEPEEEPSPEALAPSGLTAAVEDGGVALSWTAPAEDAGSVTGYEVLRAQGSAELATLAADTGNTDTTYTDSGVTGDLDGYRYQVKALRGGDASQGSNVAGVLQSAHAGAIIPLADVTLISNLGQSAGGGGDFSNDQAQAFTTGSNSGGYSLTKVVINSSLGVAADFTVSVHENDSGAPGTSLGTLTKPTLPASAAAGSYEFTHSGIDLAASTTYFIVVDSNTSSASFIIYNTGSDAEDTGGATGWSIGDSSLYRGFGSTGSWTTWAESKKISVTGTVKGGTTNSDATGAPVITGTPAVGELLTADISNIGDADGIADADFEYQWIAFDGTTDSDIEGATGETYRPLLAHLGQTIKVRVSFDDDDDNAESLTSAATAAVTASTYGQVIWAATLTVEEETVSDKTFFGYNLFAGRGSLEPVEFTYDGVAHLVTALQYIEGDTLRISTNHSLGSEDFNLYLDGAPFLMESPGLIVDFSDHGLSWTDEQEVEVRLTVNRPATGAPAITGKPEVGETLTAGISGIMDEDGLPAAAQFAYQWISNDGTDDSDIDGATDSTYTLVEADAGKSIKVRVSFTDDAKFPEFLTSAAVTVPVAALVSNVGQTAATGPAQVSATQSMAQGFTTGANTGGYTLGSVELAVSSFSGTASDITVSIYSESSGDPGTVVHTLTTPASISAAVTTFTAPSGATLAAGTTYYVVISTTSSGISLSRTDATAEDTGGVSGWSIADSRRFFGLSGWNTTTNPLRMRVNGDAATSTNSPATGAPTISGTPAVGELLTADISGIGDADGIADADFEYQWIANDGTTDSDISGATGETYRPLLAHLGQTIKVRVTFDDDEDNAESLTSAPTATVTASTYGQVIWAAKMTVGRHAVFAFIIWGFSHDDSVGNLEPREFLYDGEVIPVSSLAHVTNSITGQDIVQLVLASGLGDGRFILYLDGEPFLIEEAGEQGASITINFEDHGISWSNNQEVEVRLTVNRPATGAPAITGTAEVGQTLTADASAIEDPDGRPADADLDYQWVRSDGVTDEDIDGATGSTYTLVQADAGKTLKVRVSFTDDAKFPESLISAATTAVTVPVAALVSNVGQTATGNANVTATQSQGQGFTTGSDSGGYTLGSVELAVSSFSGTASDITVSIYSESSGDPGTLVHTLTTPASISTPVTTFTAPSGTTLAAGTTYYVVISTTGSGINLGRTNAAAEDTGGASGWSIADDRRLFAGGNWVNTTSPIRMRINGATATTSTDIWSATLTVAEFTIDPNTYRGYTHVGTAVGELDPSTFSHDGNEITVNNLWYIVGGLLTFEISQELGGEGFLLRLGETLLPLGEPTGDPPVYQFSDHGVSWSVGDTVEVRLIPNQAATGAPVITGTAQVGETLTADTDGIGDPDGIDNADFSYQWIANDGTDDSDIEGATDSTYTLVFADYGNTIKVRVSFTDDNDYPESLTSTAVAVASPYSDVIHSALLTVGIGAFFSGYSSNTDTGDLEPAEFTHNGNSTTVQVLAYIGNEFHFQTSPALGSGNYGLILDDTPIQLGAASGSPARHQVSDHGLTWTVDQQVEVWLVLNNAPTGEPVITGTPVVNQTLTADISGIMDTDGRPADDQFSYRWIRSDGATDSDISRATNATYKLGNADLDKTIKVRVTFTDGGGFPERLTSDAIGPVTPLTVSLDWSLVPSGLGPGDRFRLMFISSGGRNARPTSIDTYNTWIQNLAAAGHTDIQGYSSAFNVVGSTVAVDARDNTGTTYTSSDKGVAIYWLNGNKVADQYQDFYDGSWDEEASMRTQMGSSVSSPIPGIGVWTGSDHDGTEALDALGDSNGFTKIGKPNSAGSDGPLSSDTSTNNSGTKKLYGLSDVFEVRAIEVPADWSLVPSGLNPGDRFRLMFLTTSRNATPTDIDVYNKWVQDRAAGGHDSIREYAGAFNLLGCTEDDAARDNTRTTYTDDDKGVPIYWLNGPKVVDEYEDLYDGDWDEEAKMRTRSGTEMDNPQHVWTGCGHNGAVSSGAWLGHDMPTIGLPDGPEATGGPLSSSLITAKAGSLAVYALSEVFEVAVPTIEVPADWSLAPSGLQEGDQFRLLFISSAPRNASPSEIATYNTWIQARAANGHTDIQDYSSSFRAVGSTEDMDARDNTYTTYTSSDKGVAIYWLGGNKVADDYEDFYDEDWDEEASMKNESGTAESGVTAWTGSDHDGTEMLQGTPETSRALGNSNNAWVRFGKTNSDEHGPLSGATANRSNNRRIYGLSGVFEVVAANNPATGALTISGTAQVGGVLTANLSNVTDPDGLVNVSYSYQWIADDGTTETDIDHATGETYRPITADEDKTVKVRVSFTDDEGNPESLTSAATGAVSPWDKGELIWSALLTVGEYDTGGPIVFGFSTGLAGSLEPPTFTFASTDITITTLAYNTPGSTLQLNAAIADQQALGSGAFGLYLDEAHWLFTNPASQPSVPIILTLRSLSWTDEQEVEVRLTVNHPATGAPVVTGTPEVGETLTADISAIMDEDGLPVLGQLTYQWISNDGSGDSDISGATDSTFTPGGSDLGKTIKVRVSFTDNANFREVLTSDPVDPVGQDDWLWAATMTVGVGGPFLGYQGSTATGSLTSSSAFAHDSTSYEVQAILRDSTDLTLKIDADLPFDFRLHVGTDQFDKGDAFNVADSGDYSWPHTGLSWSVGDTIPVWLVLVPSGPGVASVTVDQATITKTLADVTVTVANLQNTSHTVYLRYRVEGGSWPAAANQSTPTTGAAVTFTLTGLTGNTEYDVAASLDSGFASGVKTATFTTSPTKPGKTRSVDASTTESGTLFITWQAPDSDGGSAITGYKVQWKSGTQSFGGDPSREHTTGDSIPNYLITGLSNGTEYTVRVIAVNAVGDGPPSDTTTGTPVGPPDAPPNVQAGSGHQQLTVSWGAPNDGGSAITEYTLQWKSGGQSFTSTRQRTIAGTSRTDTIPSLTNGTEYTVRVRATTALGDSGWSAEAKGTPREGPHVSLVKVKEPISCTVTFVALEFVNLDTATEYQAHLRFRAQGSSSWTVLSPQGFWSSGLPSGAGRGELNGPSPAFTLTDLAYETAYEVQAALGSGFVDGLATTTFSTPNLSEVGLTPLSPGDGTLGLRMTRPTSEGRVDGYLLQWKSGDEEYDDKDTSERQADVPGSGDREYTITGLDNGVEYTVRAMAYNDNGVGVPSSEVRGTPEAPPNSPARGAPTISGTAQVGETLTADTDGIEDDDGLADAVYSYQWLADDADIAGATSDTYTPVADDVGKAIKVKVSFRDDRNHQESLTSAATAAVAEDPDAPTEPPNAPRTVRIVGDTNTSLTLTWDAPDGGTAVTEYRVQWLTVGEGFANARRDGREAVVDASARSHTIRGLTKYGFYQVRVLAVNGAGESERSNTAWGFPGLGEGQYGHG